MQRKNSQFISLYDFILHFIPIKDFQFPFKTCLLPLPLPPPYLPIHPLTPASANGQSRSPTFLIAYLLSQNPTLTPTDALALIRQGRPSAHPNSGFLSQLALYHTMGCPPAPATHPIYQRWLYQRSLEANLSSGRAPSTIHFSDDDPSPPSSAPGSKIPASSSPSSSSPSSSSTIRCRRCRTPLATSIYLVPHDPPSTPTTSSTTSSISLSPCAHHFLQPLSWMRSELEQGKLEGRLECPKRTCRANVGKYAWQGMRCSCGGWVVPGISVAKGRVDEIGGVGGGLGKR